MPAETSEEATPSTTPNPMPNRVGAVPPEQQQKTDSPTTDNPGDSEKPKRAKKVKPAKYQHPVTATKKSPALTPKSQLPKGYKHPIAAQRKSAVVKPTKAAAALAKARQEDYDAGQEGKAPNWWDLPSGKPSKENKPRKATSKAPVRVTVKATPKATVKARATPRATPRATVKATPRATPKPTPKANRK